jgi:DNA/RNA-binding domain of Phe-tRNA-synthetase-like protein
MTRHYFISQDVFAKFPGYRRGVVLAHGVHNLPSPRELVDALRQAEQELCTRLTPETIISHPRIESWREAYRSLGVKPSEFRPSVEALARRVLKGDPLPTISTLVDIGTLASIRNLMPIGAHAIDHVTGDIGLRLASGAETFEPFGAEVVEHPLPGEIVFVEGEVVLTRRWTWRQAKHTLVVPETTAIEVNVDGLPPLTRPEVERICQEVAELVAHYCGGTLRWELISADNPVIALD